MYTKKSSMRSSRVENGHIDSALRTAWEENDANVAATLFGDVGDEKPVAPAGDSNLRFLIASACRFGGPLLLLGRSNVHGMSKAAHALQGGPDSSHFTLRILQESQAFRSRLPFCPSPPFVDTGVGRLCGCGSSACSCPFGVCALLYGDCSICGGGGC